MVLNKVNEKEDYNRLQRRMVTEIEAIQRGINSRKYLKQNPVARKEANLKDRKKFLGDVSCKAIQLYLNQIINKTGLEVVGPNVYINGIPNEIDLLIVKLSSKPIYLTSMYQEEDIISAMEVKTNAKSDDKTVREQLKIFDRIKAFHSRIDCLYVAIYGSNNAYKKIKEELNKNGYGVFVFENGNTQVCFTGEFEDLINRITAYNIN